MTPRIQHKTYDPWAFVRNHNDSSDLFASPPTATSTITISPRDGVGTGWRLFWHALGLWVRRRHAVTFEFSGTLCEERSQ